MGMKRSRISAKSKPGRRKAPKRRDAYHHGALRQSLVAATEAIILERGVDGFTLREAARRAGVSPAAPAHHFGDARGLLSEVATLGFKDFAEALRVADAKGGSDARARLYQQGLAYVDFALRNRARFQLMWRADKLDLSHPGLDVASSASYVTLENAIRALVGEEGELSAEGYGALMGVWSIVHGFAHLAIGGQFDAAARTRRGEKAILEDFLPLALKHMPRLVDDEG